MIKQLEDLLPSRIAILAIGLVMLSSIWLYRTLQQPTSWAWLTVGVPPQVVDQLERSLADLKTLSELDASSSVEYRQRFDELSALVNRLRILEHNREAIIARYKRLVLLGFAMTLLSLMIFASYRKQRREARLGSLQEALTALADGRTDLDLGERRRDTIGRIAWMIERTSSRMARDQKRLRALQNLSAWQEAARRHAHEMRTPLTGARLELTRLRETAEQPSEDLAKAVDRAAVSIDQELDRLARFTQQFTSFARLPKPRLASVEPAPWLGEFVATFDAAWPELSLRLELAEKTADMALDIDADMVRQVLVNLCDNAALAIASQVDRADGGRRSPLVLRLGLVKRHLALDVIDAGPGVALEIRERIFEPYTTTRSIGSGMGLGLAICRKIMLDHGGDLELLQSSEAGTTFRLWFPLPYLNPNSPDARSEIQGQDGMVSVQASLSQSLSGPTSGSRHEAFKPQSPLQDGASI